MFSVFIFFSRHEVEATIPRADSGVFVPEFSDQGQVDYRTMGEWCPTRPGIAHPSKARFILEHES
jgi:hypothetical protein